MSEDGTDHNCLLSAIILLLFLCFVWANERWTRAKPFNENNALQMLMFIIDSVSHLSFFVHFLIALIIKFRVVWTECISVCVALLCWSPFTQLIFVFHLRADSVFLVGINQLKKRKINWNRSERSFNSTSLMFFLLISSAK